MTRRVIHPNELPAEIDEETTNQFVVQILSTQCVEGRLGHTVEQWLDYASIKDTADMFDAKRLVSREPYRFRIFGLSL